MFFDTILHLASGTGSVEHQREYQRRTHVSPSAPGMAVSDEVESFLMTMLGRSAETEAALLCRPTTREDLFYLNNSMILNFEDTCRKAEMFARGFSSGRKISKYCMGSMHGK